jgi:hypothetical protein
LIASEAIKLSSRQPPQPVEREPLGNVMTIRVTHVIW